MYRLIILLPLALCLLGTCLVSSSARAQVGGVTPDYDREWAEEDKRPKLSEIDAEWKTLARQWQPPEWLQDAKFGLWISYGPQSIPRLGGGWYARHMYLPDVGDEPWGRNAYKHHCETYGHPSEFGYKDLIRKFTAEQLDTDALVSRFKDWGARYVAILVNHHDNYDLYPSSVHQWNSVNVGPKRDLVGEFRQAAQKHGLPWAATVHANKVVFPPAGAADEAGPKQGLPYDLALTKEDGKGQWWEGLDPRQLYGPVGKPRNWKPDNFDQRTLELVENYRPDMLYFDSPGIPVDPRVLARYYKLTRDEQGVIQGVVTLKKPAKGTMLDLERGQAESLKPYVWQTDTTMFNGWYRKEDDEHNLRYDTRCLIEMLADITSKNGVLLLNVALWGDGSIPDDQAKELDGLAAWLKQNGEAIYATRPWKTYGEGGKTGGGHFSERTWYDSEPWDASVVRFTRSKDNRTLYAIVFGQPAGKKVLIGPLGKEQSMLNGQITTVKLLGSDADVSSERTPAGLEVRMPAKLPFATGHVLRIETTGL